MHEDKQHIIYTAADIQRYVQGKMTATEMHAIEKAALEDPFLADAIEGMQSAFAEAGEHQVTGQLQELREQFNDRVGKREERKGAVVSMRWWKLAAAAMIVVVGALWIYNTSSDSKVTAVAKQEKATPDAAAHNDVAMQQTPHGADSAAAAPMAANSEGAVADETVSANEKAVVAKATPPKAVTARAKQKPTAPAPVPELKDSDNLTAVNSTAVPNFYNRVELKKEAIEDALERKRASGIKVDTVSIAGAAKKQDDFKNRETELITITRSDEARPNAAVVNNKTLSGFVKGRVTDPYNNPVANATVRTPNTEYNFQTDNAGYFKVPLKDSVTDVAVSVVGYGVQNFRLQNNVTLNELQLQPNNTQPSETVVVRGPMKAKRSITGSAQQVALTQDAAPVYGWLAYEQYLEKNKQLPPNTPAVSGKVVVSFYVNKKEQLSDFKIEESLGKVYDDEAIRLISQGPAWKLLNGRKARITVIVRF